MSTIRFRWDDAWSEVADRAIASLSRLTRAGGASARRLRVLAARLGNAGQSAADSLRVLVIARNVAQRNDTNQTLVAVDDRQAPHLDVGHVECDLIKVVVVETVFHLGAHHVAHF